MKGIDATGKAQSGPSPATARTGWFAGPGQLFAALLFALSAFSFGASQPQEILLVRSGEGTIYSQTIAAFEQRLEQLCVERENCPETRSVDLPDLQAALEGKPGLIVSLGQRASLAISQQAADAAQLHVLVSRTQHQEHYQGALGASAIYLEQPLAKQLDFIRFLLPDRRRIGVLLGKDSEAERQSLQQLTESTGLDLHIIEIDSPREIGRRLNAHGDNIDVLLALPDPAIYNRDTLAGLFLTAYRNRIPVIGFSEGMIRAGAIAGIYSSPVTTGTETAQLALELLDKPQHVEKHPTLLEIQVNRHVAGALHIQLPTDSEIQRWKEAL